MKFLNDSAWLRMEKLKKHNFGTKKTLNLTQQIPRNTEKHRLTRAIEGPVHPGLGYSLGLVFLDRSRPDLAFFDRHGQVWTPPNSARRYSDKCSFFFGVFVGSRSKLYRKCMFLIVLTCFLGYSAQNHAESLGNHSQK